MRSLILALWRSKGPTGRAARAVYWGTASFSVPLSRRVALVWTFPIRLTIAVWRWLVRVLIVDPMIRSCASSVGARFHAGSHLPYISGSGDVRIGNDVTIAGKVSMLLAWRESPATISIGDNTYIGHNALVSAALSVSIGANCLLSNDVTILDSPGHPIDPELRRRGIPPLTEDIRPVTIGQNVWIGLGTLILPGSSIGDNSVIAARSVVTGSIPPGVVAAGVPARVIKQIGTSLDRERSMIVDSHLDA